jgi:hypothetical protein
MGRGPDVPGDETHDYDLVIEFAEQAYQEILTAIFDTDDFLSDEILDPIGADEDDGFRVNVLFDRPTDVPASAQDPVDVRVEVGDVADPIAALRMVVGVDVDRTSAENDLVRLNFEDRLYLASARVRGIPIPGFEALVRSRIPMVPVLPIPVERGTDNSVKIREGDVRIVDDTSTADRDASAFLMTFGGGTPGDRGAFSRSFISPGGNGGIAVAFDWLCRVISPRIDEALELGGVFTDCRLTETVRIDEDDNIDLTDLSLSLEDGFIRVSARVEKSGFCYEAAGTVSAAIRLAVVDGRLIVTAEVGDPDVDVDVPWYCYLAGAVIGGLVGLLFGVIGSIVGAILVPLILWISTETVEGVVQSAIDRVAEALNEIAPDLNVPAVGLSLIFSDVFIDDVTIGCRVSAKGHVPIRSEGYLDVPDGGFVDLDRGIVGSEDLLSQDLAWRGTWFWRRLEAVCGARLARTDRRYFDEVARGTLYGYAYDAPNPIELRELASFDPIGGIFGGGGLFDETMRVFGVRTNEGRWSAIQVVEVDIGRIRLRYRTWEKRMASVEITGGWSCEPAFDLPIDPGTVVFEPSDVLADPGASTDPEPDPCAAIDARIELALSRKSVERLRAAELWRAGGKLGTWTGTVRAKARPVARFDAAVQGFRGEVTAAWRIQDEPLSEPSGEIDLEDGVTMSYEISGRRLTLRTRAKRAFEFLLGVEVRDDRGGSADASRCVRYEPGCDRPVRYLPPWAEYRTVYLERFGVVEVPEPPEEEGPPVDVTIRSGSRTST